MLKTSRANRLLILALLCGLPLLVACGTEATPTPLASSPTAAPAAATPTEAGTTTGAGAATQPAGSGSMAGYLDDRSTPKLLVMSYADAVNRKEIARAYSYWDTAVGTPYGLPSREQVQQTGPVLSSVEVTPGVIGVQRSAGALLFTVPVTVHAMTADGKKDTQVGCFSLSLPDSGGNGVPPFASMRIKLAHLVPVPDGADTQAMMGNACQVPGFPSTEPVPETDLEEPPAITHQFFLDNRSDAVNVLRSYYNAINRQEYVRSYSYWDDSSGAPAGLPAYQDYAKSFADIDEAKLTTGDVVSGESGGKLTYAVPVVVQLEHHNGTEELSAGCYRLQLVPPAQQTADPFHPFAITAADLKPAQGSLSDATAAMNTYCK